MKTRFQVAFVVLAAVASCSSLTYGQSEVTNPPSQKSTRPLIRNFRGKVLSIDPARNTIKFVETNNKLQPTVEVVVNANTQMEEIDIPFTSLKIGDTVFFSSELGSQREIATVASLKPLTLQMEGGAKKLSVNTGGEKYAFTWDYPLRRDWQIPASPFIWAAPNKVTFRAVNPTTYRYDIRDFATLVLTVNQPLEGKADPMRFTADKATLILKRAADVRLTRSTPLKISDLTIGQLIDIETVVQPNEELIANRVGTVYVSSEEQHT